MEISLPDERFPPSPSGPCSPPSGGPARAAFGGHRAVQFRYARCTHAQGAAALLPAPAATPTPSPTSTNYNQSAGSSTLNLGSNFLERLGNQAFGGINRVSRTNPGGGGASESAEDCILEIMLGSI